MRETQQNIQNYKKQLRHVKEKIATAGLLFLVSVTMLTTASFAWLVLSTSPEVSNIKTSVAGNGNLEIALASGEGEEPAASTTSDGSIDSLLDRNITWGNLINLSHEGYGLSQIILRPAALNQETVTTKPLRAVQYTPDGRLQILTSDFAFSNFNSEANSGEGAFTIDGDGKYGVRAISSVTYKDISGNVRLVDFIELQNKLGTVKSGYTGVITNKQVTTILGNIMTEFLNDKLNDADPNKDYSQYNLDIYNMMTMFLGVMNSIGEYYVDLANFQLKHQDPANPSTIEYDFDTLIKLSATQLNSTSLPSQDRVRYMDGYDKFRTLYQNFLGHYATIEDLRSKSPVTWAQLEPIVNFMVHINSTTINGTPVSELGVDDAGSILGGALFGGLKGVVHKGCLFEIEELIGEYATANVKVLGVSAAITTSAKTKGKGPYLTFALNNIDENIVNAELGEPIAGDVYGMAIDLWVRTNADNSHLTLEGEIKTEKQPLRVNNNIVYEYEGNQYYHVLASGVNEPSDLTSKEHLKTGDFYYKSSNEKIDFNNFIVSRDEFVNDLMVVYEDVIIGYDGVNRVWEEGAYSLDYSTTQGRGSCYTFEPTDPIQKQQMLKLLESLTIAFFDQSGEWVTYANMDTSRIFDDGGKVTVPMVLRGDAPVVMDDTNNPVSTIMPLERGESKMITAIVYLDGTRLTNQDVEAASSVNGHLNIQFGSTVSLDNMDDEDLYREEVDIIASVNPTEHEFNPDVPANSQVSLTINGVSPSRVYVQFSRKINDKQATLMREVYLTNNNNGTWTCNYPFTSPGTYILDSAWLDGVEYGFRDQDPIEVIVSGSEISSVFCDVTDENGYANILTADEEYPVNFSVGFASDKYTFTKVNGVMRNSETGDITLIPFSKDPTGTSWSTTYNFRQSGIFVLDMIQIDGEYYELPNDRLKLQKTINISLGLKSIVKFDNTTLNWEMTDTFKEVNATVEIIDNAGNNITGLSNATLTYQLAGQKTTVVFENMTKNGDVFEGRGLILSPGIYEYLTVVVDGNAINKAQFAPDINVISPFEPKYISNKTSEYQFVPTGNANFKVEVEYLAAATIWAEMYKESNPNSTIYVKGTNATTSDTMGEVTFVIPKTVDEVNSLNANKVYGEGKWIIKQLYVSNFFKDGEVIPAVVDTLPTTENSIVWDSSMIGNKSTEVIYELLLNARYKNSANLDLTNLQDEFTDALDGNIKINPADFEVTIKTNSGKSIDSTVLKLDDVQIAYVYDSTQNSHGWINNVEYKDVNGNAISLNGATYLENQNGSIQVEDDGSGFMTNDKGVILFDLSSNDGMTYTGSDSEVSLTNPGIYVAKLLLTYTYNNVITSVIVDPIAADNYSVNNIFTGKSFVSDAKVTWKQPYVKFVELDPAAGTNFTARNSSNSLTGSTSTVSNSMTDYSIDVYFKNYKASGEWFANAIPTMAKTRIYDAGKFDSAKCIIVNSKSGDYNGRYSAKNVEFNYTSTNPTTGFVDIGEGRGNYTSRKSLGKNSRATYITVKYNDKTYTFDLLNDLVVNNNNGGGY